MKKKFRETGVVRMNDPHDYPDLNENLAERWPYFVEIPLKKLYSLNEYDIIDIFAEFGFRNFSFHNGKFKNLAYFQTQEDAVKFKLTWL